MSSVLEPVESGVPQSCVNPLQVDEADYLAWVAEDIRPEFGQHLDQCLYCQQQVALYSALDQKIGAKVGYQVAAVRTTCPPNQQLGEYLLNMLTGQLKNTVKEHLKICSYCKEEFTALQDFMAEPALEAVPFSPLRWLRRVLAELAPPTFAGSLRGRSTGGEVGEPQIYQAEELSISITVQPANDYSTDLTIMGMLQRNHSPLNDSAGAPVLLLNLAAVVASEQVDDLGYFVFEQVPPAPSYNLEITLEDKIVIVPAINPA